MRKITLVLIGAFVFGILVVSLSVSPVYAAKEALWEETFDSMEEGEETGMSSLSKEVDMEVQAKIANGGKGKALKVTAKEGQDYASNYNLFGLTKDMTFPNENAILTFSYYASGIASLGIMTNDRTIPENCDGPITSLVQNKWTKVVLRISKFKVKSPKGTIKEGDEFRYIYFIAGVNSAKPLPEQFFVVDDIKLTIGQDDAKGGDAKEEKKK
ncbi:MAG: hypothetical protein A2044_07705 [Candidatus Firestonebacteria bacterium GWA2_43_8]|nr:MAG: hypothetical protein A2044_07705 [Candidatus Firestonebacteria bacterium GWA2_43_8]